MKRLFSIIIITALLSISLIANAGRVVLFDGKEVSGTTLFKSDSGISVVMRQDQTDFPASFDGIYSLGFPTTITYGDNTANPNGTGNAATAGVTITYYYITIDSKDAPTNAYIESLGTSGLTLIVTLPINSGSTPSTTHAFTPNLGKWLFIAANAGITDVHKPGVAVAIQ